MKGDRVEIVIDTGDGVRTFDVQATRAGRRVEVTTGRNVVEVVEVTRSGTVVRTARFMASRVLALVEHPRAEATALDDDERRRAQRRTESAPGMAAAGATEDERPTARRQGTAPDDGRAPRAAPPRDEPAAAGGAPQPTTGHAEPEPPAPSWPLRPRPAPEWDD